MSRSKRKGPYTKLNINLEKKFKILPRSLEITSHLVGLNFLVHSGRKLVLLDITNDMVGHKSGEFISTREKFEFKKKKKK